MNKNKIDKLDEISINNRISFFENMVKNMKNTELTGVELAKEKARIYCKENPEWEMICNIPESDDLYYTWEELEKEEKKPWIDHYGKLDADKAWNEFSYGKCKVENGFIAEDGLFYHNHPIDKNIMMVFKIRGEKFKLTREYGRKCFEGLKYKDITERDILNLEEFLQNELMRYKNNSEHGKQMGMILAYPRKKDIKILKRTGLKHARIQINGSYFSRREAITFNENGFIGFGGELDDKNIQPIIKAFEKWCKLLKERKNKISA